MQILRQAFDAKPIKISRDRWYDGHLKKRS